MKEVIVGQFVLYAGQGYLNELRESATLGVHARLKFPAKHPLKQLSSHVTKFWVCSTSDLFPDSEMASKKVAASGSTGTAKPKSSKTDAVSTAERLAEARETLKSELET